MCTAFVMEIEDELYIKQDVGDAFWSCSVLELVAVTVSVKR